VKAFKDKEKGLAPLYAMLHQWSGEFTTSVHFESRKGWPMVLDGHKYGSHS
jgi:hypothetical protein